MNGGEISYDSGGRVHDRNIDEVFGRIQAVSNATLDFSRYYRRRLESPNTLPPNQADENTPSEDDSQFQIPVRLLTLVWEDNYMLDLII